MAKLSTDEVRHVAELAKLQLTEEEVELFAGQLSAVLDYAAALEEVDTSHVPPTATVLPLRSIMREDVVKPSLPVVGGGVHPATAVRIIQDLGADIMLASGGAIQGHPDGAQAGGRAMLQAIGAAMQGIPLKEKARQHPELFMALQAWAPQELQD